MPLMIDITVAETNNFEVSVEEGKGGVLVPPYEGDYVVTPSKDTQTLLTGNKKMLDNLTVKPIPVRTEKNQGGGTTVIIG